MSDPQSRDCDDRNEPNPHALSQTIAELCSIAETDPTDAVDRCRSALMRFGSAGLPRRERVSSTMALYLATKNRMARGRSKTFVEAQLAGALRAFHAEGRNAQAGRHGAVYT